MAGCGRFGFDVTGGDGAITTDVLPPAETLVIPVTGATGVNDAVFDPSGNLAIVGNFLSSVTIGGQSMTTAAANEDLFVAVVDPSGLARWLWTGGATVFGSAQNVAWFADGSLAASGYFSGRLTNGGGLDSGSRQAATLIRFAPSGAFTFARHYGGSSNVQARGVAVAADRIGLGGIYSSSVDFGAGPLPATTQDNSFIATMDAAAGDVRNRALLANGDVYVNDIAFGAGEDLYVVGRFTATTDFGMGPVNPEPAGSSGFVARYDMQLGLRWVRTFGESNTISSIRVLANGDAVVGGEVAGSIAIDSIALTSAGSTDGWVARFAATDGTVAWMRTITSTGLDSIKAVAVRDDRIFFAGSFSSTAQLASTQVLVSEGGLDLVVGELALDGSLAWSKQLGGTGQVSLGSGGMSVDATGRLAAIPVVYDGELLVEGQRLTTTSLTGAAIVVAIPPN